MAKKYSKKSLEILAKAQYPLGIKIDTRNLAEEKFFTIVSACNNEKIFTIKEAVNNILNRECKFIETICDSRHSNIAFWGSGYEYEKICESGILVQILY
jgi:plasmid replication initiation protein